MLYPDDGGRPNARLLDLACRCVPLAAREDLSEVSRRIVRGPKWPDTWPGEHYRLLAALVSELRPRVIVEVGTYQGLGSLALAKNLPPGGRVHTFDVVPFARVPGHVLTESDVQGGRIVQVIDDVTRPQGYERHLPLLRTAEMLFIDAEKDGRMETRLIELLSRTEFEHRPIVVFDDIRVWNMLRIWHDLDRPKLDLTSFGHYSGTGLVDWCG
jgi:predicted O-methyltransferase YrrM